MIDSDPTPANDLERHVVLVSPEIHWNTGNTGRTCLATGARLHLIKPLGFSLACRQVKRAGLDYWPRVNLSVWDSFDGFKRMMRPRQNELVLLTKNGRHSYWSMPRRRRLFLVLGSETRGLPDDLLSTYDQQTFHIPIVSSARSLNLSTAAALALYESIRHVPLPHDWRRETSAEDGDEIGL